MSEERVLHVLKNKKAITGKDLLNESGLDEISLWRLCADSKKIITRVIGNRYLRLDRNVQGYARLSPSIKREFLTYTVCGLKENKQDVAAEAESLEAEIKNISRQKFAFALSLMEKIVDENLHKQTLLQSMVFLIGGDVVFDMAHLEPRPERSTGKMVRGSDLDVVVIHKNDCPEEVVQDLDKNIYREKYISLVKPECREEVDYVIKDVSKTKKQLRFDRFESMIAAKILWEGKYLYGCRDLFEAVKKWLEEEDIPAKLKEMEIRARTNRTDAESFLLKSDQALSREEYLTLFYTSEESEEIY
jgi:hypothetical protein